jgi:hypothetical protein
MATSKRITGTAKFHLPATLVAQQVGQTLTENRFCYKYRHRQKIMP